MRKILTFTCIFAGTRSCVFIFNIVLYSLMPAYKHFLSGMVSDDNIPVVTVTEQPIEYENPDTENVQAETEMKPASYYKITYIDNDSVALDDKPAQKEPVIVDKQYHEDCGTGKGYWVITYDDGSTEIE